jgi:hypothetical protein
VKIHSQLNLKKMKKARLNILTKKMFLLFFIAMILVSLDSYAKKITFLASSAVPAARGYIKVTRDKNKNYVIQVQVLDLAEVNRLQPSKHAYVVWILTDKEIIKNLGRLNSQPNQGSKQLKASFETLSSSKPIKIFITAEDDAGAQNPNEQVILTTDRFLLD